MVWLNDDGNKYVDKNGGEDEECDWLAGGEDDGGDGEEWW